MKKNMHPTDRLLRAAVALLLVGLYVTGVITGMGGGALLIISGILLLTSFTGMCPLYTLIGIHPRTSRRH
ncbi:YgaP-like transmembrane domain [Siphonobacter aquaeclarae]|uniref:Inner membrane protein YgaP-like transmembrane domain-containing protein n=1 Tax=Siphonobacter aquaeclarae TaxID=563176 RepID=A0A1G9S6E0_9BACT|nr:YgaP-like transmembrane domain [Siphonobacter aquaeclarae]MBO9640449.1 DUF2892 domain-containing protein [Siphonobacter aquaeclarae]SDM30325.1 Protein of unknown function [Siphonobacter aquaeclarae]